MKRAVIVGCGNIAAVHAAVLTAQKDTELVASLPCADDGDKK